MGWKATRKLDKQSSFYQKLFKKERDDTLSNLISNTIVSKLSEQKSALAYNMAQKRVF